MTLPRVVLCSMWRNDLNRRLVDRVEHLLAKSETYPNLRWVWVVGDSTDGTIQALSDLTTGYDNVRILNIGNTGIEGNDAASRLKRLSVTANEYFYEIDRYTIDFDYILVHESDIASPRNIVNRLVAHAEQGRCPIAGWPTIKLRGEQGVSYFYDVWAYRKDGVRFTHDVPYHKCFRYPEPFQVDSFGTCFLFHAEDAPLIHMQEQAFLDLCRQLRAQGRTLWVDPTLEVQQPVDLWEWHNTRTYA